MKLYGYFRSSAAFRVRIGLNLKALPYSDVFVHLRKGQQHEAEYRNRNPLGVIPTLEDGPNVLTQSLAILEYLDETVPTPAILPSDPVARARVRAIALTIACDIHPLNNLRVLGYLERTLGASAPARQAWYAHWIAEGLGAIERMLAAGPPGPYCHGTAPTLADICLVPQVYNARRYDCPLDAYPRILAIEAACMKLPAFDLAQPARQPDAE